MSWELNSPLKFVYWKIAARAQSAMLMCHAANLEYIWEEPAENLKNVKSNYPFGQLPCLEHNNKMIPQSGTITRYCANLSSLMPEDIFQQLDADMLIEFSNDIYNLFVKAKYAGDELAQQVGWQRVKTKQLPEKLDYLVKFLGEKPYFSGEQVNAGDIAIFSILNLAFEAGIDWTPNYPTLNAHYERVKNIGSINEYLKNKPKPYFVAN
jgi:glutathione S-transferase